MLLPEHRGRNSRSAPTVGPQSISTLDEWVLCLYCYGVTIVGVEWYVLIPPLPLPSSMSLLQCILPHCAWMSFPVLPGGPEVEVPPTLVLRSFGSFSLVPAVTPAGSGHSTKPSGESKQNSFNPGLWSAVHSNYLFIFLNFKPNWELWLHKD